MYFIYLIVNLLNGKIYVGKTNNPHTRWLQHQNLGRILKSKQLIHKAIGKYGCNNFTFFIIENLPTEEDSLEAEIWWIAYFNSVGARLYNLTIGGDGASGGNKNHNYGKHLSEDVKRKISESRIGKYSGENNPMYGRQHNITTKLSISKINQKVDDKVVSEIKKLSKDRQYTGRQLAIMFNLSTAQISRIINGKRRNL